MSLELKHLSNITEKEFEHYRQYTEHRAFIHCHPFFSIFGRPELPPETPKARDIVERRIYKLVKQMAVERDRNIPIDTTPSRAQIHAYIKNRLETLEGTALEGAIDLDEEVQKYIERYKRDTQKQASSKQIGIIKQNMMMIYIQIFQLYNELNFIKAVRDTNQFAVLVLPYGYKEKQSTKRTQWLYPNEFIDWIAEVTQNQPNFIITESAEFDKGTLSEDSMLRLAGIKETCGFDAWYYSGNYLKYCLQSMIESIMKANQSVIDKFGQIHAIPEVTIIYNGQCEGSWNMGPEWDDEKWIARMAEWPWKLDGKDILPMVDALKQTAEDPERLHSTVYAQKSLNTRVIDWLMDVCIKTTWFGLNERKLSNGTYIVPNKYSKKLSELNAPVAEQYKKLTTPHMKD